MPPGEARAKLVARLSGGEAALLREVESLLEAHDNAGRFLAPPPPGPTDRVEPPSTTTQVRAGVDPAAQAEAFLRDFPNPAVARLEEFVAQLPEAARQEARERIEAAVRVRQWRGRDRRPPRNMRMSRRTCRASGSKASSARADWAWCMPRMMKS